MSANLDYSGNAESAGIEVSDTGNRMVIRVPSSKLPKRMERAEARLALIIAAVVLAVIAVPVVALTGGIFPRSLAGLGVLALLSLIAGLCFLIVWNYVHMVRLEHLSRARRQECLLSLDDEEIAIESHGPLGDVNRTLRWESITNVRVIYVGPQLRGDSEWLSNLEARVSPDRQNRPRGGYRWLEFSGRDGQRVHVLPGRDKAEYEFVQNLLAPRLRSDRKPREAGRPC